MTADDRPRSEEAEAIVLGTLMHYPAAYAEAARSLSRDDFGRPAHQLIWDVITQCVSAGRSTAPVPLHAAIQQLGQLRQVKGGDLLWEIAGSAVPAAAIGEYVDIMANAAKIRRKQGLAHRVLTAIDGGASPETVTDLISSHLHEERERTSRSVASSSLLDWTEFFAADFSTTSFLPGRLLGEGQQIAIVGDGKAGKSLFCQEWAWRAATGQPFLGDRARSPVRVLCIDAENGQDEIQRRLLSFGAGPGRMGELRYASFPPIPPLDTAAGGLALMALVQETKAELVFIDTISRFISGKENDADPWLALYRYSLMPLKRAGVASVRLDHFGKDKERGSRGNSAKTQDVDHVWELTAQGSGALILKRTHSRSGVGPDLFNLRRLAQRLPDGYAPGGTRHVLASTETEPLVPGTVRWIIARLDEAQVPVEWGRDRVSRELARLEIRAAKDKIDEVIRVRRSRAENQPANLPYSQVAIDDETSPDAPGRCA